MNTNNNYETVNYKAGNYDKYDKKWFYCHDTTVYYKNKKKHRDDDLPAVVSQFDQYWYQNGKLHRDGNKPAMIYPGAFNSDFTFEFYQNGLFYREGNKPNKISYPYSYSWMNPRGKTLKKITLSGNSENQYKTYVIKTETFTGRGKNRVQEIEHDYLDTYYDENMLETYWESNKCYGVDSLLQSNPMFCLDFHHRMTIKQPEN